MCPHRRFSYSLTISIIFFPSQLIHPAIFGGHSILIMKLLKRIKLLFIFPTISLNISIYFAAMKNIVVHFLNGKNRHRTHRLTLFGQRKILPPIWKKKGFQHLILSDRLREEIQSRGQTITRSLLQDVGNELREKYGGAVLAERTAKLIDGTRKMSLLTVSEIRTRLST